MTNTTAIPRLGAILRELVTRAGLRPCLEERGLGKDLDDLAQEERPGAHFRLLERLESQVLDVIRSEAGPTWCSLFQRQWRRLSGHIQKIVQTVDVGLMGEATGREIFFDQFACPLAIELITEATRTIPGPPLDEFLHAPFAAWLTWTGVTFPRLEHELGVDERTFRRWQEGARIERLRARKALLLQTDSHEDTEAATGWLIIAIVIQSASSDIKHILASKVENLGKWENNGYAAIIAASKVADQIRPQGDAYLIEDQLQSVFSRHPIDPGKANELIERLEKEYLKLTNPLRIRGLAYIAHYRAHIAAITSQDEEASRQYRNAFLKLWWNSGSDQGRLLDEALIFSAGIADKVATKYYWDMSYILGTGPTPYRDIDAVELRRLSAAFEARFRPRRAKSERIMPGPEIILGSFEVTKESSSHPNRKKKFSHGDTRRTPLMDAVLRGSLIDVRDLIAAGGDINVYIEETGESALSLALHRAKRRGKDILYEILALGEDGNPRTPSCAVSKETANRSFGVSRETPLKLAVDLADPAVIRRLVGCGADLEAPCANATSALFHAMHRFARGWIPGMHEQSFNNYLNGAGRPDIHDARRGAISSSDLAATRQAALLPHLRKPWKQDFFSVFRNMTKPDPDETLLAIEAILICGGNPNRRQLDENGENWTPTLYAAAIGHLPLLQLQLAHGGDPHLTLNEVSLVDRRDALWAATRRNNSAVISFLRDLNH